MGRLMVRFMVGFGRFMVGLGQFGSVHGRVRSVLVGSWSGCSWSVWDGSLSDLRRRRWVHGRVGSVHGHFGLV